MICKTQIKIHNLILSFVFLFLLIPSISYAVCADVPVGGNYTVSSSCAFAGTVNGVDNGGITVASGQTLTVNAGQIIVWSPGSSITIVGSIAINNTAQLKQSYIWYTDQDADGYPTIATPVAQTDQPSNGRRRKDLTNFTYVADFTNDHDDTVDTIYPGTVCNGDCSVNDSTGACVAVSVGENGLTVCTRCNGSSLTHVDIADATQDTEGSNQSATCYSCNGSGVDTARTVDGLSATALGCSSGDEGCRKCTAGTCGYYTSLQHSCDASYECNGSGVCEIIALANGEVCSIDGNCLSTHCANSICCNTACTGGCTDCNLSGTEGTCTTAPDTNWGAGLYNCAASDAQCVSGTCRDCSSGGGYLASDGCSGCAGQGGNACWHAAVASISCNTGCSSYGGCIAADWNDDTSCTVMNGILSGSGGCTGGCVGISGLTFMPARGGGFNCYYRKAASQNCASSDPGQAYRFCVCQY